MNNDEYPPSTDQRDYYIWRYEISEVIWEYYDIIKREGSWIHFGFFNRWINLYELHYGSDLDSSSDDEYTRYRIDI
jgi:hypothetical protein